MGCVDHRNRGGAVFGRKETSNMGRQGRTVERQGQCTMPSANDKITTKAIHLYVHIKTGMKTNAFCSDSCQMICASANMCSRRLSCASPPEMAMMLRVETGVFGLQAKLSPCSLTLWIVAFRGKLSLNNMDKGRC